MKLLLLQTDWKFEAADASTSLSASLYEPPLDSFGADAVDRWFTEEEVEDVVAFANGLAV
ncbi:MAG: hypothetical protein OHK0041_22140 [Anaerolineales bacterium]